MSLLYSGQLLQLTKFTNLINFPTFFMFFFAIFCNHAAASKHHYQYNTRVQCTSTILVMYEVDSCDYRHVTVDIQSFY